MLPGAKLSTRRTPVSVQPTRWPCALPAQNDTSQELGLKLPVPLTQKVLPVYIHTLVRVVLPPGQPTRAICGTMAPVAGWVIAAARCAADALVLAFAAAGDKDMKAKAAVPAAVRARLTSLRTRSSLRQSCVMIATIWRNHHYPCP